MKTARIFFAAALVLLCGCGWYTQISTLTDEAEQLETGTGDAAVYMERGLYQKAMQSYRAALAVEEDGELRDGLLEACKAAWSEELVSTSTYQNELRNACAAWPERADYWARLIELLRNGGNYREAYSTIYRAEQAGAASEELSRLATEVRYSYTTSSHTYEKIDRAPSGYAAVYDGSGWGVIAPDGNTAYDCDYTYITPYSDERSAVFCTEEHIRLFDAGRVVQAILTDGISQARAYGDGLLPVCRDGKWSYLACEDASWLPGSYEDASAFQNGAAAVKENGRWRMIAPNGEPVGEAAFSDVKLHGNGDYCFDGVMAAAVDGVWNLYTADGAPAAELQAAGLDVFLGGGIAFQDASGKWGFVNRKGEVLIEPQFQQARSFSGGLAAVYDGNGWGFIDRSGKLAIPCKFLDAGYFSDAGCCFVSTVEGQFYTVELRFPPLG